MVQETTTVQKYENIHQNKKIIAYHFLSSFEKDS